MTRLAGKLFALCTVLASGMLVAAHIDAGRETPFDAASAIRTATDQIAQAVAGTAEMRLDAGGTILVARYSDGERTIFAEKGWLIERGSYGERRLSPGNAYVSDVHFVVREGSVTPSFQLAERIGAVDGVGSALAATFDSDILANATNTFKLGATPGEWKSINNTLFFSTNGNVGVSANSFAPTARLHIVDGDLYVGTTGYGLIVRTRSLNCWKVTANSPPFAPFSTSSVTCP